jgi:hypothetical protein
VCFVAVRAAHLVDGSLHDLRGADDVLSAGAARRRPALHTGDLYGADGWE